MPAESESAERDATAFRADEGGFAGVRGGATTGRTIGAGAPPSSYSVSAPASPR